MATAVMNGNPDKSILTIRKPPSKQVTGGRAPAATPPNLSSSKKANPPPAPPVETPAVSLASLSAKPKPPAAAAVESTSQEDSVMDITFPDRSGAAEFTVSPPITHRSDGSLLQPKPGYEYYRDPIKDGVDTRFLPPRGHEYYFDRDGAMKTRPVPKKPNGVALSESVATVDEPEVEAEAEPKPVVEAPKKAEAPPPPPQVTATIKAPAKPRAKAKPKPKAKEKEKEKEEEEEETAPPAPKKSKKAAAAAAKAEEAKEKEKPKAEAKKRVAPKPPESRVLTDQRDAVLQHQLDVHLEAYQKSHLTNTIQKLIKEQTLALEVEELAIQIATEGIPKEETYVEAIEAAQTHAQSAKTRDSSRVIIEHGLTYSLDQFLGKMSTTVRLDPKSQIRNAVNDLYRAELELEGVFPYQYTPLEQLEVMELNDLDVKYNQAGRNPPPKSDGTRVKKTEQEKQKEKQEKKEKEAKMTYEEKEAVVKRKQTIASEKNQLREQQQQLLDRTARNAWFAESRSQLHTTMRSLSQTCESAEQRTRLQQFIKPLAFDDETFYNLSESVRIIVELAKARVANEKKRQEFRDQAVAKGYRKAKQKDPTSKKRRRSVATSSTAFDVTAAENKVKHISTKLEEQAKDAAPAPAPPKKQPQKKQKKQPRKTTKAITAVTTEEGEDAAEEEEDDAEEPNYLSGVFPGQATLKAPAKKKAKRDSEPTVQDDEEEDQGGDEENDDGEDDSDDPDAELEDEQDEEGEEGEDEEEEGDE